MTTVRHLTLAGLLLGVVAIWGWTFVAVKDAAGAYGVLPFLAVRFAIGAACLGVVCARRVEWRTFRTGMVIGVVLGSAFLLQTLGLVRTSASNTGLITGLFVVFAPLANRLLFGVRMPRVLWLAIALSLVGLAMLTGAGPAGVGLGELLTLGGAVLFGLHVALLDRLSKGRQAVVLAFGQLAGAALLFAVCHSCAGEWHMPSARVWTALIITGVLASAAAYLIQTYVQQHLSATETAMIMLAEPPFAVAFGCLLQGDHLTAVQMVGGAVLIGAMALAELYLQEPVSSAPGPENA